MIDQNITDRFNDKATEFGGAPALMRHQMGKHGLNESDIGQMVDGKGVLLAPYFQHRTAHGFVVGPHFNVFAAPQDMKSQSTACKGELLYYRDEIKRIASIENLLGHDGILIRDDTELYRIAGTEPEKLSSWHMPSLSLVSGSYLPNYGMEYHNPNNMYALRNKGGFTKTFTTNGYGAEERPDWYRTLTHSTLNKNIVWRVWFANGEESWEHEDNEEIAVSARAVRCEMVPE